MSTIAYKDSLISIYVSENFKKRLKEVKGFELDVKPVSDDAIDYISGYKTPSETFGVLPDSKIFEVIQDVSPENEHFWNDESFPVSLKQVIDYFEDESKGEVSSNIAGPNLKNGEGFRADFRFVVKRDRRWAENRNIYYLTFLTKEDIDTKKADNRYHDREAEALLLQW